MAFTWTPLNSGDPIENEDLNEIHDNLDSIYSYLEISRPEGSGAAWSDVWILSNGDAIRSIHPQELRDVTDYADDHWCPTHYSSDDSGVKSSHYSSYKNDDHVGHDATHDSGVKSSHYSSYKNNDHSNHDSTDQSTFKSGDKFSHHSDFHAHHWSTDNPSYDNTHYSTYKGGNYGTHKNNDHSIVKIGYDSSHT